MLGIRYIKSPPTTYLLAFRGGKVIAEGAGLSLFYYAPATTLVAVPIASTEAAFIFEKVTADFQAVTIQGQVTFRVADPVRLAGLLNYSLRPDGFTYVAKDPDRLVERVVAIAQVQVQQVVQDLPLTEAIRRAGPLADEVLAGLRSDEEMLAMGIETLGVAIMAVKPSPETGRALEATAREAILRAADEAIYNRRNAAVANERAIKQSELDTEIAVEQKRRTIRETQMDAEAAVRRRKHELRQADMEADIAVEDRRQAFVRIKAGNTRTTAEAEAHRIGAVVRALEQADPRTVQALAAMGMEPGQLIAQAFGGIAERAERIGQLNVSPDLLQALMTPTGKESTHV